MIKAALEYVSEHFDMEDCKESNNPESESAIIRSAKQYLDGLQFSKRQETIDTIITALVPIDEKE